MKRAVFLTIFIFSIVLNLAVAATLGWHFWGERSKWPDLPAVESRLTEKDFRFIGKCCMQNGPPRLVMELRQKIVAKRAEVLDALAKNPGDPSAAEAKLEQLTALSAQMEREAAKRISKVMSALPADKRDAFLIFLKNRAVGVGACMHRGPCRFGPAQMGAEKK
jgi:Spy/CpxP family protein refolding chaperone